MPPSSLTLNWNALLSTSLFNWQKTLFDEIATSTAFLYQLMKRRKGGYKVVEDIGERIAIPLMYEIGEADSFSGYDVLPTTPMDGITTAFYDWRQAAVAVAISGEEKLKNSGEAKIVDLLEGKMTQAELGIKDFFDRRLLIGAGGSSITSAYTSALNGSAFVDPLPLLVKYDPTTSTVIGNINQGTYSWWRNQTVSGSGASTYAAFLKKVRHLKNLCSKGAGGNPDLYLSDLNVHELYEAALAAAHRNPSYQRADIPFENIQIFGQPLVWDEFVPDAAGGSATQSTASGTLYAINSKFWEVRVHKQRNFTPSKPKEPIDQDATLQHILWFGGACVSNRRKQGVMGLIDTTVAS